MAVSGTFIGDFSSFQAAVEQADVKVRQFETNSAKVETTLNRVANSFSGQRIIQEATLMASAIERGGGAARLTTAELERAGKVAAEAAEKMRALGIAVPANIDRLAQSAKGASGFMSDLTTHIAATAAGMVSATAVVGGFEKAFDVVTEFLGDSIEAYAESEAAAKKLTIALQAQGTASPDVVSAFKDIATETQKLTAFEDDAVTAAEAMLVQIGDVQPKAMKRAVAATADLAAALGTDLQSAVTLVAKAAEGNITALAKMGVQLDKTKIEVEGVDYIFGKLEERFGGQAQGQLDTYAGRVAQLKNTWGDLMEAVGQSIVDDPLVRAGLKDVQEGIVGVNAEAEKAVPTITQFWTALMAPSSGSAIDVLTDASRLFRDIDAQLKGMTPPPPKQFQGFTDDIDAADKKSRQFALNTATSWEEADKKIDSIRAKHEKDEDDRNKKFLSEQSEFDKLMAESTKLRVEQSGTARDAEIANIRLAEATEIDSLIRRGQANESNIALIHENASRAINGLAVDWQDLNEKSRESLVQQRDDALTTYNEMLYGARTFSREVLDAQLEKYRDLVDRVRDYGHEATNAHDKATEAARRQNDVLGEQQKKQQDLIELARKNQQYTSSFSVTAATFDVYTPPQGVSKSAVRDLLKQGFSMENALAILQAQLRGSPVDLSKWPQEERGPRVPGFQAGVRNFAGGLAEVGERGREIVNLPAGASVFPWAEWDRLNSEQANLFRAGQQDSERYMAILERMSQIARPGFGFDSFVRSAPSSAQGSPSVKVEVNVSGVMDPQSATTLGNAVSQAQYRQLLSTRRLSFS